LNANVLKVFES